ncbi:hypothetical protein PQG02_07630 [Nostoc sp. UHCC 0926]|uniref:hypothetical protein n=1 Tax=unclassified Nostoc TaxID=2593658 RepID=UPI00236049A5|nr:hypothetical protein [Nostoc sp. UHCC 0926]WDD34199.1 hypothetical protein PQG02_07630 [Nostoc sp. UHCC 0926]
MPTTGYAYAALVSTARVSNKTILKKLLRDFIGLVLQILQKSTNVIFCSRYSRITRFDASD